MDTRTPDQAASSSGGADTCHTTHGYINDKDRYLARLKRIEGQARGLHSMVDEEQLPLIVADVFVVAEDFVDDLLHAAHRERG